MSSILSQSPVKRNLDYAFPPFASGLPSVYERAGFDVNKNKTRSRSSSRAVSASSSKASLAQSRAETPLSGRSTINSDTRSEWGHSSSSFSHSSPQLAVAKPVPAARPYASAEGLDVPTQQLQEFDLARNSRSIDPAPLDDDASVMSVHAPPAGVVWEQEHDSADVESLEAHAAAIPYSAATAPVKNVPSGGAAQYPADALEFDMDQSFERDSISDLSDSAFSSNGDGYESPVETMRAGFNASAPLVPEHDTPSIPPKSPIRRPSAPLPVQVPPIPGALDAHGLESAVRAYVQGPANAVATDEFMLEPPPHTVLPHREPGKGESDDESHVRVDTLNGAYENPGSGSHTESVYPLQIPLSPAVPRHEQHPVQIHQRTNQEYPQLATVTDSDPSEKHDIYAELERTSHVSSYEQPGEDLDDRVDDGSQGHEYTSVHSADSVYSTSVGASQTDELTNGPGALNNRADDELDAGVYNQPVNDQPPNAPYAEAYPGYPRVPSSFNNNPNGPSQPQRALPTSRGNPLHGQQPMSHFTPGGVPMPHAFPNGLNGPPGHNPGPQFAAPYQPRGAYPPGSVPRGPFVPHGAFIQPGAPMHHLPGPHGQRMPPDPMVRQGQMRFQAPIPGLNMPHPSRNQFGPGAGPRRPVMYPMAGATSDQLCGVPDGPRRAHAPGLPYVTRNVYGAPLPAQNMLVPVHAFPVVPGAQSVPPRAVAGETLVPPVGLQVPSVASRRASTSSSVYSTGGNEDQDMRFSKVSTSSASGESLASPPSSSSRTSDSQSPTSDDNPEHALSHTGADAQRHAHKPPKQCRGCMQVIKGKSVRAADGTLSGRWHAQCFNCYLCAEALSVTEKARVLNDMPYCAQCYHTLNNSSCRRCGQGIEGSCLETRLEGGGEPLRYHAACLSCVVCNLKLDRSYFEVNRETYCAEHAFSSLPKTSKMHRRYTQFLLV